MNIRALTKPGQVPSQLQIWRIFVLWTGASPGFVSRSKH